MAAWLFGIALAVTLLAAYIYARWLRNRRTDTADPADPVVLEDAAEVLREGIKAYKLRDFGTARQRLIPLGEQGDLRAQQCMALMCLNGLGGTRDLDEARKWLQLAAAQGDKASRARLKRLFPDKGKGTV